jgi:hypothetical protein
METFKRGQVIWGVWRYFTRTPRGQESEPDSAFKRRLNRLLELDSETEDSNNGFVDSFPRGSGTATNFKKFDAFCLAVALDLVDQSVSLSEAVFLFQNGLRTELKRYYKLIMENEKPTNQRIEPSEGPGGRVWDGAADFRVYAIIRKIEISEVYPLLQTVDGKRPKFVEPKFCRGVNELALELANMGVSYRSATIVELSQTAAGIAILLDDAPEIKRGPSG